MVVNSSVIPTKPTRTTQGLTVATLRGRKELNRVCLLEEAELADPGRYRARTIPKAPVALSPADRGEEQLTLL